MTIKPYRSECSWCLMIQFAKPHNMEDWVEYHLGFNHHRGTFFMYGGPIAWHVDLPFWIGRFKEKKQ